MGSPKGQLHPRNLSGSRTVRRGEAEGKRLTVGERRDDPMEVLTDFSRRHLGPRSADIAKMLAELGVGSVDELIAETVPGPSTDHCVFGSE